MTLLQYRTQIWGSDVRFLFNLYALVLAMFAIFCAVLMTEPGQMIGVPRDWLLYYYRHMHVFWVVQSIALAFLWVANIRGAFWKPLWMCLATLGVLVTFWVEAYAMPLAFPTQQFDADFYSVDEADRFIPENDDRVYVVETDGEIRIFPRYHLQLPHVVGWESEETDYAIAFCGLSNLPMVVETDYGLGKPDIQVLGQAHNNLIFKDINNDKAIQHITMQSEFSEHQLTVLPNTMMDWKTAKEKYPQARVYIYEMDRLLDEIMLVLFEQPLEDQRNIDDPDFIFDTLTLEDTRLNPKQEIYGYVSGDQQIAIDTDFAHANDGFIFDFNGETLQISIEDSAFRLLNSKGEQVPTHNGVHYGIWTEFFPDTEVLGK